MYQLDAIRMAESLRRRLVDVALDRSHVRNQALADACRTLWSGRPERGGLISDLWVVGAFPSATPEGAPRCLDDLVSLGTFDAVLRDHVHRRGAFAGDLALFTHQLEAVTAVQPSAEPRRPALVISAGTGAGKTEAFLLPILNELYSQDRRSGGGIQCLILYPMNALVNDQVERLHNWLQGQDRLSLFHFTSETPEGEAARRKMGLEPWAPPRLTTREEARQQTPDILITNYSMLEYMLCRPQDASFFGPALRAVVLDEAHLYNGTLAAEITLLLRRLLLRCGRDPEQVLQIATSATLAGDPSELRRFGATAFGKAEADVKVIEGSLRRPRLDPEVGGLPAPSEINRAQWLTAPTLEPVPGDVGGKMRLVTDCGQCDSLAESLRLLVPDAAVRRARELAGDRPALLLHETIRGSCAIHRLLESLWPIDGDGPRQAQRLADLAAELWPDVQGDAEQTEGACEAAATLLRLGAAARPDANALPVIPNRIHLQARAPEGLVVCLSNACGGQHWCQELGPVRQRPRSGVNRNSVSYSLAG